MKSLFALALVQRNQELEETPGQEACMRAVGRQGGSDVEEFRLSG